MVVLYIVYHGFLVLLGELVVPIREPPCRGIKVALVDIDWQLVPLHRPSRGPCAFSSRMITISTYVPIIGACVHILSFVSSALDENAPRLVFELAFLARLEVPSIVNVKVLAVVVLDIVCHGFLVLLGELVVPIREPPR